MHERMSDRLPLGIMAATVLLFVLATLVAVPRERPGWEKGGEETLAVVEISSNHPPPTFLDRLGTWLRRVTHLAAL
jgi:hypothetical protein